VWAGDPCGWYFGDAYRGMDAVHRCHVVTHELGHKLGRPDGLGADGDPLGVMGRFAVTPQCAEVQPLAPDAPVAAQAPVAVTSATPAAPIVDANVAAGARLEALNRQWDVYHAALDRRDAARNRRDRCERQLRRAARTAKARRRAAARCHARVTLPALPLKPRSIVSGR
jgi:hypothetical protein